MAELRYLLKWREPEDAADSTSGTLSLPGMEVWVFVSPEYTTDHMRHWIARVYMGQGFVMQREGKCRKRKDAKRHGLDALDTIADRLTTAGAVIKGLEAICCGH
jgi:hypothetical protein